MDCGSGWEINALLSIVSTAKVISIDIAPTLETYMLNYLKYNDLDSHRCQLWPREHC
jgi:hypothetical protein